MKHSAKIHLAAAAVLALSVVPSVASTMTTNFGPLTGTGFKMFGDSNLVGPFQDYYTFTIPAQAGLSDSITNSYTISAQNIKGLTLGLYEGTVGSGTLIISTGATNSGFPSVGSNQATLTKTLTDPGSYYFEVSASPGSSGKAVYNGNLAYTVLPLPSGLPMLSGAILALAAAGHLVSKHRKFKGVAA